MNFRKAGIFQRDTEKPEVQNDSGGMLAVWGSPGSGKTVTAVKIAKGVFDLSSMKTSASAVVSSTITAELLKPEREAVM